MPIATKHHHPIQVSSFSLSMEYMPACLLLFNFIVIINLVAID
jgi:hypothetical protein